MNVVAAVAAGIALAACTGLRAFLPLLGAGLAGRFGHWPLAPSMQWLASDPALIAFGVAAAVELLADKIPYIDHALDVLHTVLGPVAAVLVSFSAWSQLSPQHALLLSLVAGVPIAAGVHLLSAGVRAVSTGTTGGLANPVVSVAEDLVTGAAVVLAFVAPLAALLVIALLIGWLARRRARRAAPGTSHQANDLTP